MSIGLLAIDVAVPNRFRTLGDLVHALVAERASDPSPLQVCVMGPGGGLAGHSPQVEEILRAISPLGVPTELTLVDASPLVLRSAAHTAEESAKREHQRLSIGAFLGLFETTDFGTAPQANVDIFVATTALEYAFAALDERDAPLQLFSSIVRATRWKGCGAVIVDRGTINLLGCFTGLSPSDADFLGKLREKIFVTGVDATLDPCGELFIVRHLGDRPKLDENSVHCRPESSLGRVEFPNDSIPGLSLRPPPLPKFFGDSKI